MNLKRFRIPLVLFLISLFLNVYGIWWGLPNYYTWSVDDVTPTQTLKIMNDFFKIKSQYPMFHYVLSGVFYAPYLSYLYLTGGLISPHKGFPYGFTDPLTSLTVLLLISRLISAIMGALAVVFIYLSVKEIYGRKAALFSALCVCFSYIFILFAHLGNLDTPYVFWLSLAVYAYVRLLKTYKTKYYVLLGLFAALAMSTKDQILGFFVLLPIPLLYLHLRHHLKEMNLKEALFNKKLVYCLLCLLMVYSIANNVFFDFSGFKYRIGYVATGEGTGDLLPYGHKKVAEDTGYPFTFLGILQILHEAISQIEYCVGFSLLLLLLLGLFYCVYKLDDYTFAFLIPMMSYYLFNFIGIGVIRWRYNLPIIMVLSIFAGRFLSDLIHHVKDKKFIYPIIFLIFGHTFFYGFSADLTLVYDSRHSAENWMLANIDKDAKIETYQDGKYLPRFHALGFKNVDQIFFFWNKSTEPPVILFEPVTSLPDLESLNVRNPDYIVLAGAHDEKVKYVLSPDLLEKKKINLRKPDDANKKIRDYLDLLLSEKAGYKIIKIFDNKIPFAPETDPDFKRTNIPVIILEREENMKEV